MATCSARGCSKRSESRGLCHGHYSRFRRESGCFSKWPAVPVDSPLLAVRLSLEASRRAGIAFAPAWTLATATLPEEWDHALTATRSAWQSAYNLDGSPVIRVDALLAA